MRLRNLRNLEAFNVLLFWGLFAWSWRGAGWPSTWGVRAYALLIVSVILVEGACYWHLKLESLSTRRPLPGWFARTFTRLGRLNLALVALAAPVALLLYRLGLSSSTDLILGLLLLIFAVLEHINYFHLQLMHDNRNDLAYLRRHRRLRRSPLAQDLLAER